METPGTMPPTTRHSSPPFLLLAAVLTVFTASSNARLSSPTSASLLPAHRFRRTGVPVSSGAKKKKLAAAAKKKLEAKGGEAGEAGEHAFEVPAGYNMRERPNPRGPVRICSVSVVFSLCENLQAYV